MNRILRSHCDTIASSSIEAVKPDEAVRRALSGRSFSGRLVLVSVGKAAWRMARAAYDCLGDRIDDGIVITKYGHVMGKIPGIECCEAGHPLPDNNSYISTKKALDLVSGLTAEDSVLFLLSGGGSALFELPLIEPEELESISSQLISCGADIVEINTIRKRLSAVKGGRFAKLVSPAKIYSVVLSDILGDPLDMIASGPACPDSSTSDKAIYIADKYSLKMSEAARECLQLETPKSLDNVTSVVTGSVRELCLAAAVAAKKLGYEPVILTDMLQCEAKEAGRFLSSVLRTHVSDGKSLAFIAGGETVVKLTGKGKGGRNQELALAAAEGLRGIHNAAVFSIGSDGTDGPTDAAGGYADGDTAAELDKEGIDISQVLRDNDSYNALMKTGGLIFTGPTGTNVNDVAVALCRAE